MTTNYALTTPYQLHEEILEDLDFDVPRPRLLGKKKINAIITPKVPETPTIKSEPRNFNLLPTLELPAGLIVEKVEMFDLPLALHLADDAHGITPAVRTTLKSMLRGKNKSNRHAVKYVLGKGLGKLLAGRLGAQRGIGLQGCPKEIRAALARPYYWDIDFVNCHPVLLLQICQQKGWTCSELERYVKNRDEVIKKMNEVWGWDRDKSKTQMLKIMYGGDATPEKPPEECSLSVWLLKFDAEVKTIMNNLVESKELVGVRKYALKTSPNNEIGCACAISLQTIERQCLLVLEKFLNSKGREMDVYIHDGGLVRKKDGEIEPPHDLEIGASDYVFEQTGYRLSVQFKKLVSDIESVVREIGEGKSYAEVKAGWEKEWFLCMEESAYCHIGKDKISRFSKTELITSYEHIVYEEEKKCMIFESHFLEKWIKDPTKRCYDRIVLLPPPLDKSCDVKWFNSWRGFRADEIKRDPSVDVSEEIKIISNHLSFLCNEEKEAYEYLLDWMAQLVTSPGEKIAISWLLKSIPGLGKELVFFGLLKSMLGSDYVSMIANAERDVFGDFNSLLSGKLFIALDEFRRETGTKYAEMLKNLISSTEIEINQKGIKVRKEPNYIRVAMFCDKNFPVSVDENDRRFVCIDSKIKPMNAEYFSKISSYLANDQVIRGFYDLLKTRKIAGKEWIKDRPETEIYRDSKRISTSREVQFLIDWLIENNEKLQISITDLRSAFANELAKFGENYRMPSPVKFGIAISQAVIPSFEKMHCKKFRGYKWDSSKVKEWLHKMGHLSQSGATGLED